MANPGIGYRLAADVLMEVAFHLCQPNVYTPIVSYTASGFGSGGFGTGGFGGGVGSSITVDSTYAMYPGALVVVGWQTATAEVVQVLTVPDTTHFTGTLLNAHNPGDIILGPTFPVQESTDPIFTQSEMLSYLSRAQNEFLTAVPLYYQRFTQTANIGIIKQSTPATAIQVERVAASTLNIGITSLNRAGNTVTMVTAQPHLLSKYSTFSITNPNNNLTDTSFLGGAFAVASVPSSTSLTYVQVGSNAAATGGAIQSMSRLYEITQEEMTMRNRNWQTDMLPKLTTWFEDRMGLYGWGTGGKPGSIFPIELLCSVRDVDSLALLDGFLVPDMLLHGVKYLTLAYAASKEGVYQQPVLADFAMKRYTQVVLAAQRYLTAMRMEVNA